MGALRYLNTVLTVLAILLAFQLWTSWTGGPADTTASVATPAYASGIPNAGAQRQQMVDLLKRQSQQLDALTKLFESGQARVRLDGG